MCRWIASIWKLRFDQSHTKRNSSRPKTFHVSCSIGPSGRGSSRILLLRSTSSCSVRHYSSALREPVHSATTASHSIRPIEHPWHESLGSKNPHSSEIQSSYGRKWYCIGSFAASIGIRYLDDTNSIADSSHTWRNHDHCRRMGKHDSKCLFNSIFVRSTNERLSFRLI